MPTRIDNIVHSWSQIESKGWETLILGNGASIAIDGRFSYNSLFDEACKKGNLDRAQPIFHELGTKDFERAMQACYYAKVVNRALGLDTNPAEQEYSRIRDALVKTIEAIHCAPSEVDAKLDSAAAFCKRFKTIASLNYDLTLYWAIMRHNKNHSAHFGDSFSGGLFDPAALKKDIAAGRFESLVCYPHGALFLATDLHGEARKVQATNNYSAGKTGLLDSIAKAWNSEALIPLFVSEGESKEKRRAIDKSQYLRSVYDLVLSSNTGSVVFYGFGFNTNDNHIIEAVVASKPQKIAVSIHTALSQHDQQAKSNGIKSRLQEFGYASEKITFFDSDSEGCWVKCQAPPSIKDL